MGSQQLCLRWNHHHANLLGGFERLLSLEKFVDVTLACEGASLKAHKVVLSACSSFFEELFLENPCKHPIVILKDIRYADLTAIVEFMYRGEVSIPQEQLSSLLTTSSTLRIKGLAEVAGGDNHVASQGFEDDAASAPPSPRRKRARPKRHSSAESNAVTSDSDDDSSLPVLCTRSQPNEQIAVESPPNRRMTALPPTSSTAISVAGSSKNGNDATAVTSIMATDVDNQAGYVLQPAVLMEQTSDNVGSRLSFPGNAPNMQPEVKVRASRMKTRRYSEANKAP